MQSIEMYFNDMIANHSLFKQAASSLLEEVSSLTPEDIHNRCENLSILRKKLTEDTDQLFIRMEFLGTTIFEISYIGDFQRALDKSILACDSLYNEILVYKNRLIYQSQ